MALRIKEGSTIKPYGESYATFTSESKLDQDVLEHLAKSFPNDIESEGAKKTEDKKSNKK